MISVIRIVGPNSATWNVASTSALQFVSDNARAFTITELLSTIAVPA